MLVAFAEQVPKDRCRPAEDQPDQEHQQDETGGFVEDFYEGIVTW